MKRILFLLLCAVVLTGCSSDLPGPSHPGTTEYLSRFDSVTGIVLSDQGISVNGGPETASVYTSRDIIYYEDRDTYPSGRPYGAGTEADKHSAEEAAAHTVVNITAPGAYRVSGKLSAGQIRINLGENAYYDTTAVVELILSDADITCTVAPAILFQNIYECDNRWSPETAQPYLDTADAGANLILEGENTVNGSYVARIYKDKKGEKKKWKQDGAIYSYMSMNVFGPGSLDLTAENEGIATELHLALNNADLLIKAQDDCINVNEYAVSVVTINGGNLTLFSGLGIEGDGIDTNGYLVINNGRVIASGHPAQDTGLDSDIGTFTQGGFVASFGAPLGWADHEAEQVTIHLQFAAEQAAHSRISLTKTDGTEVYSVAMGGEDAYPFSALFLSSPALANGETYHVYVDGVQMGGVSVGLAGGVNGKWLEPPGWGFQGILLEPDAKQFSTEFCITDTVHFFSGLSPAQSHK